MEGRRERFDPHCGSAKDVSGNLIAERFFIEVLVLHMSVSAMIE